MLIPYDRSSNRYRPVRKPVPPGDSRVDQGLSQTKAHVLYRIIIDLKNDIRVTLFGLEGLPYASEGFGSRRTS